MSACLAQTCRAATEQQDQQGEGEGDVPYIANHTNQFRSSGLELGLCHLRTHTRNLKNAAPQSRGRWCGVVFFLNLGENCRTPRLLLLSGMYRESRGLGPVQLDGVPNRSRQAFMCVSRTTLGHGPLHTLSRAFLRKITVEVPNTI